MINEGGYALTYYFVKWPPGGAQYKVVYWPSGLTRWGPAVAPPPDSWGTNTDYIKTTTPNEARAIATIV